VLVPLVQMQNQRRTGGIACATDGDWVRYILFIGTGGVGR